ncbi:MAG TPA: hypothetical protein VF546_06090 [Pyrinomonadaceae bacterium]|jgi:antitoxin component YwqK of YwqJK toxin-antitoxin module
MKRLPVALFFCLAFALRAGAQPASDRAAEGLKGPVQAVRLERVELAQDGQTVKQSRYLRSLMRFDEQGYLLETTYYKLDGSVAERRVYTRADDGRQVARIYDGAGQMTGKTVTTFDAAGRSVSTSAYNLAGALTYKSVDIYDERGRLVGELGYRADGSPDTQMVVTYDAQNNAESAYYDARGLLSFRSALTEQRGYTTTYNDDGTVLLEETRGATRREFDAHGNWIKQTYPRSVKQAGKTEDTIEVRYRGITYYERPASKQGGNKD